MGGRPAGGGLIYRRATVSFDAVYVRATADEVLVSFPELDRDYWVPKSAVTIDDDPCEE